MPDKISGNTRLSGKRAYNVLCPYFVFLSGVYKKPYRIIAGVAVYFRSGKIEILGVARYKVAEAELEKGGGYVRGGHVLIVDHIVHDVDIFSKASVIYYFFYFFEE